MFEGHALETPQIDRFPLRSAPATHDAPHVVQTIAPILSPYLWKMSLLLGISFAGFSVPVFELVPEVTPGIAAYNCFVIFMRAFGGFGFLCYLVAAAYEIGHFEREWQLHAEERRAKLPGPKPQAVNLTINKTTETGTFHQESRTIVNPPSLEFLSWLWWSQGPGGRIPGERAIEAQWHATADGWLDTIAKEGFLEKTGTNDNAPRRFVSGVTFVELCARFGHSPTPDQITDAIAGVRGQRTAPAPHPEPAKTTVDVQK